MKTKVITFNEKSSTVKIIQNPEKIIGGLSLDEIQDDPAAEML